MKKFLSLFAAILFAGTLMAEDFHLVQVTSVEKDKTYAFVRNGKALKTPSSGALQTVDLDLGTIDGTQDFLWELKEATGGYKLHNVTKAAEQYLRNSVSASTPSSADVAISNKGDNDVWAIEITSGIAKFTINGRFLGETKENENKYKAYLEKDLDSHGHDFLVYELVAGASVTANLLADKLDLKTLIADKFPFALDTSILVTAENLSADISTSVDGSNVTVPASLAKEGGKLDVHVAAAKEVEFSDTIILTSGTLSIKVPVEANIITTEGEGTEENPFALADLNKIKSGLSGKHWVKGIIVGCAKKDGYIETDEQKIDSASIVLGTTADQTEGLTAVNLSKSTKGETEVRNALNVYGEQASNIGKEVQVYGKLEVYKGTHGITGTSAFKWRGEAAKLKDVSIKLLKINGAAVAADKKVYEYTVSAEEDLAQVEVVFELGNAGAKADKASGFKVDVPASSTDPATEVKLTITSEDETVTAEYTIKVSRAAADAPKSNDATLKEVKINNEVVAEKNGVFAYKVAADVNLAQVEVSFICNEAHATADKENPFKVDVPADSEAPATEVIIKITAEDKATTKEYKISVSRAAQGETPGPDDDPDEPDDQGLDQVNALNNARKILVNGMLIIEHNGVRYNIHGQQIQ